MTNTIPRPGRALPGSQFLQPLAVSLLAIGALTLGLLAPVAASAATPTTGTNTPTATNESARPGHWPASVQGQPSALHTGGRAGDYIWHDCHRLASAGHACELEQARVQRPDHGQSAHAGHAVPPRGRGLDRPQRGQGDDHVPLLQIRPTSRLTGRPSRSYSKCSSAPSCVTRTARNAAC